MDKKYKIYIGCREETFIKLITVLVDSGLFVYSYMRCKNMEEIKKYYASPKDGLSDTIHYSEWMVIGYHEECKRTIAAVSDDWSRLREFEQITLEDFLKKVEEENATRRLQTQV